MGVIKIFKRILCTIMTVIILSPSVLAYDASNLPQSMPFWEATGINDSSEIASATICDIDGNKYKNLTRDEITYFFNTAKDIVMWRKINPTPLRCNANTLFAFSSNSIVVTAYASFKNLVPTE